MEPVCRRLRGNLHHVQDLGSQSRIGTIEASTPESGIERGNSWRALAFPMQHWRANEKNRKALAFRLRSARRAGYWALVVALPVTAGAFAAAAAVPLLCRRSPLCQEIASSRSW